MTNPVRSLEEILAEHPFTFDFPEEERKRLAEIGELKTFPPGTYLFREGRVAEYFILLVSGLAAVELHVPERGIVRLQTVGPGDAVGWSWVMPPYRASFDIRTLDEVQAVVFDANKLRALFDQDCTFKARFLGKLLSVVADRVHSTRLQLLDMYAPPGGES